jgi:5'-methylthioadenosine phosphorylase
VHDGFLFQSMPITDLGGIMGQASIGIIGGSGVYDIEGLENKRWEKVESPFGEPSDELLFGELHGVQLAFLPRHGRGHKIPPSDINFRANIDALKRVGVTDVVSVSAVGSLREHLSPGTFVIVDSTSTARSRERNPLSATDWWRTSPWRIRYVHGWANTLRMPPSRRVSRSCAAAPIW